MRINTVNEFLVTAIECELKAADLYASMADMFSRVPDVFTLFIELSEEEKIHIEILNKILNEISEEDLAQTIDNKAWEFVRESMKCMEKDLIGGVSNLDEAYEVAHEIETHEVMQAFKLFSLDSIPAIARRKIIANQIDSHMDKVNNIDSMYYKKTREQMKAK